MASGTHGRFTLCVLPCCHTAAVNTGVAADIVTGSESHVVGLVDGALHMRPVGPLHAVDLSAAQNQPRGTFGYALCGHAVVVWNGLPFDAEALDVHDLCVKLAAEIRAEDATENA